MKVVLTVPRSGPAGAFNIGDELEVSDAEGTRMIEAGQARPVASQSPKQKRSKATIQPSEKR